MKSKDAIVDPCVCCFFCVPVFLCVFFLSFLYLVFMSMYVCIYVCIDLLFMTVSV